MDQKPNKEEEDKGYYINEDGLVTFTESFLLKRGYCCGNGCKHCPYEYTNVPEPQRTILLSNRRNASSEKEYKQA